MKIVFCAYDFVNKVGGPNVWLLRLLPALQARGVRVRVLFMAQDSRCAPTAATLEAAGIATLVVEHFPETEQKVRWILEQLRDDPPDLFVPNLAVPAYFAAGWVRSAGIPTIGVLHSDDRFHRGLQEEFVFGHEFFRVSGLVCVSDFLLQEVLQRHPRQVVLRRIPCGVPVPSGRTSPPGDVLRIAYVGRLEEEQKRISEVTQALCRAARDIPGVEATLFGEGQARASVEHILETHGRGLSVTLAGKISSEEIQQHLLRQHVIVLLSDYEGLPIALMEAMACGLVPVCKSIGSGIPELVEDGVNGLLVNDRGDEFVAAIRRLKDNAQLWREFSMRSREKIVTAYSEDESADLWYRFFSDLCRQNMSRAAIEIPHRITLPPVHPWLAREDSRKPSAGSVLVNRAACLVKRLVGQRSL